MAVRPEILGKGWSFPFRFTSVGRVSKLTGTAPAESVEKVKMAISQILGTRIGTRVIDRTFGSNLRGIVFEPIDELTAINLRAAIADAIERFEFRAVVTRIEISLANAADGIIAADISFRITGTQIEGNLVYPFYITPDMRVSNQITVS
jgi:phage baseplate assembly protein W